MEKLHRHLESVTERQMEMYERGSTRLIDQVEHWTLQRREAVLLHAARKRGLHRVGPFPVPNAATSAANAKTAIFMQLTLESLLHSQFAEEPWTMSETTADMFNCPPKDTLKKDGFVVQVKFDKQDENRMWYTAWGSIYYRNLEGDWVKTQGKANALGLYYEADGEKKYYVQFGDEAAKYGTSRSWEVSYRTETFTYPFNSGCGAAGPTEPIPGGQPTPPATPDSPGLPFAATTFGRRHLATSDGGASEPKRYCPHPDTVSCDSHRGGEGQCTLSGTTGRSPGLLLHPPPAPRLQAADEADPAQTEAAAPSDPGRPKATASGAGASPSHRDTVGPLFLCLSGGANSLKCLRFRCKKYKASLFDSMSTTFFWTGPEGKERVGEARVLVTFSGAQQKQDFMEKVSLPPGVRASQAVM
nr:E2 [Equus caballus papillomavirus 10]